VARLFSRREGALFGIFLLHYQACVLKGWDPGQASPDFFSFFLNMKTTDLF